MVSHDLRIDRRRAELTRSDRMNGSHQMKWQKISINSVNVDAKSEWVWKWDERNRNP